MTDHHTESPLIALLHDELLVQIFHYGQSERSLSRPAETEETVVPLEVTVSQVSMHWRNVALNYPCLWTNILVAEHTKADHFPLNMARAYLERCNSAPLVARVDLKNEASAKYRQVLDLLLAKSKYWHRVSIHFSLYEGVETDVFNALQNLSAPWLQYLSITSDPCGPSPQENSSPASGSLDATFPRLFGGAGGCPNLELLRLSGRALCLQAPPLHITTLHLEQCLNGWVLNWPRLHSLLSQCIQLVNLSIQGTILDRNDWLDVHRPPGITMPFLRSLRICGVTGEVYSGMLLAIIAPRLEVLFIKKAMGNDFALFLDACTHAPPRFPRLNSIVLDDFEFDPRGYERFFEIFPEIRHITVLDTPSRVPTIVELLSGDINSKNSLLRPGFVPCPNLVSLTVLLHWDAPHLLLDAARIRHASGLPLMKIRLGVGSDVEEEDEEDLKGPLREYIPHVELFREADPWPINLSYTDEDDLWYDDD